MEHDEERRLNERREEDILAMPNGESKWKTIVIAGSMIIGSLGIFMTVSNFISEAKVNKLDSKIVREFVGEGEFRREISRVETIVNFNQQRTEAYLIRIENKLDRHDKGDN